MYLKKLKEDINNIVLKKKDSSFDERYNYIEKISCLRKIEYPDLRHCAMSFTPSFCMDSIDYDKKFLVLSINKISQEYLNKFEIIFWHTYSRIPKYYTPIIKYIDNNVDYIDNNNI